MAAAVIVDGLDRVLLVRPSYHRDRWLMPGGGGELLESPRQACERELVEELGARVPLGELLVVDWIPPRDAQGFAELLFVFDGGLVDGEEAAAIRLPDTELMEAAFLPLEEAATRLTAPDARRLRAAFGARGGRGPVYLEHGHPPNT